jgi:hypothetical protein
MTNVTNNLVFDCGSWGLHLHCGNQHYVRNNLFAGNTAQPPSNLVASYTNRATYAIEPFCNFKFHSNSSQGVLLTNNIFDENVAPSAGVGRAGISVLNLNFSTTGARLTNAVFRQNLYTLSARTDTHAFPASIPGGAPVRCPSLSRAATTP